MANIQVKEIPENDEAGWILHNELTGEFQKRYVIVDQDGTIFPEGFLNYAEAIENFEVRNSDVWVCSFPRSGTTWTQEMTWLIANNFNYERAKTDLKLRFPYFELCTIFDFDKMGKSVGKTSPKLDSDSVNFLKAQESPRFIKTHLPFSLLPREIRNGSKTPKMIYVMRNPKDVCVSCFHFNKLIMGIKTSIENYSKVFLAEKVAYGSFWKHILGYWENRNLPNLLITKYEDMKNDLPAVVQEVANFLDKSISEEQLEQLTKHLSFDSMKSNTSLNLEKLLKARREKNFIPKEGGFIRSGTVGKYKEELSDEIIEKFDAWITKNVDGTNLPQEYYLNF